MKLIHSIKSMFFRKKRKTKDTQKLSVEFSFNLEAKEVFVNLLLPEDDDISLSNITKLSEKYAELLVGIDYGLFKDQIFSNLQKIKNNSDEPNTILFIDSVISFYSILKKDLLNKTIYYDRPIIPPSMAFKMHIADKS